MEHKDPPTNLKNKESQFSENADTYSCQAMSYSITITRHNIKNNFNSLAKYARLSRIDLNSLIQLRGEGGGGS